MCIKVSVIIPAYNVESYISECLDSVLRQSLSDIEIICIDDSSTDSTWDILSEYSRRNRNIVLIKQEKEGPGVARNKGIQKAVGKYVCMMDADDYYPEGHVLEKLYLTAEQQDVFLCGGNIIDVYPDGRRISSPGNFETEGIHDSLLEPRLYGQTRFLYRRDFLIKNSLVYLPYVRFEDPPFVLNSILKAKKYYTIKENVYVRRAGYKKLSTSYSISMGVLNGILECMKTAREYNLVGFYHEVMENLLDTCNVYFHPFAEKGDEKTWRLIWEINAIPEGWTDRHRKFPNSYDEYTAYRNGCFATKRACHMANSIILYGAGRVARMVLERGWIDAQRIEAVVVSAKETGKQFEGHTIKDVAEYEDYSGEALFVLAGSEENVLAMERMVKELKIENYAIITPRTVAFVEDVCGE